MYNILAKINLFRLLNSKEPWFNNTIPRGGYTPIVPDKRVLPAKVLDFLNSNAGYIHKIKKDTVETGCGLASVLLNPISGIKSFQLKDLLIRGYTYDFRIIIYILLTTGFTLWFNQDTSYIPQIEYTANLIHNSFLYQVSHFMFNMAEQTNAQFIPYSSCFISKVPSYISDNVTSAVLEADVSYEKLPFNNGWNEPVSTNRTAYNSYGFAIHMQRFTPFQ